MTFILQLIRFLSNLLDFFLITLVIFFLSLLPQVLTRRIFPSLYQVWSLRFLKLFSIREHIHQKNSKPIPSQYILISNHPSGIELLWLPSRFRVIPLAKAEIKDWFIVGRITKAIGTIFVKRRDRASRHAATGALLEAANQGKNILIFPEGGCYGKRLQPFFMGAFSLSKQTGIPILPVFLHYEEENSYYWGDYGLLRFMLRALLLPKNRNAHLYIFDPFEPSAFPDEATMHDKVFEFYREAEKKYAL